MINDIIDQLNKLSITSKDETKQIIKDIFDLKLKNMKFDQSLKVHCGSEGCWVESHFKEGADSNTHSDFHGFELKKGSGKITFGDWSADEYIFNPKGILKKINIGLTISRADFLEIFGRKNLDKDRFSWSGSTCPTKYNTWTTSGQILLCDNRNSIFIIYSHEMDKRRNIDIPMDIKSKGFIALAYWSIESLETKVSRKFNNNGTAIFIKNKVKEYVNIKFCKQIDIELFITDRGRGHRGRFLQFCGQYLVNFNAIWRSDRQYHWHNML